MNPMNTEKKPAVSVICLAYNQEKYIAQCLKGFAMQNTDFDYEVLVHDDCSTDGTLDMILSYEEKYPDIFTVVTEEENQYSKDVDIYDDIMMPIAQGKYIATCEGDDYWCDETKLQKQYDFMESHPECSLVCHNTLMHDMSKAEPDSPFNGWTEVHRMTEDDVFIGWNVHTSSYFFRRECFGRRDFERRYRIFGDFIELCNAKDYGEVYSLPEIMSVYNFKNPEGLTVVQNQDFKESMKLIEDRIEFLKEYDEYTSHRHSEVIIKRLTMQMNDLKAALGNL